MKDQSGLSWYEVSVCILLLLVGIIGYVQIFGTQTRSARDAQRIHRVHEIEKLLFDIFVTEGTYPTEQEFGEIMKHTTQYHDPLDGENRCRDSDGDVHTCGYEYRLANKGFDYLIVMYFETDAYIRDLYESFDWQGDTYHGYMLSTLKLKL